MPKYIRTRKPGGTFFFTVRLADRTATTLTDRIHHLRSVTRQTRDRYPFEIDEIVILPSVLHTIWTLPEGDGDFSIRWQMLKSLFSRGIPTMGGPIQHEGRMRDSGIWQPRFWEHCIHDLHDQAAHRQMIFHAPVQAGFVNRPQDWPHSSIHRAIALGTWKVDQKVGSAYATNAIAS
ncbi:MAG: transposase [Paracoccaceae bacterium]